SATATPSKRSTRRRSSKRGSRVSLPRPVAVSGALLGGALVAWIVTYERMHGMDAGPGTDLGGLGWYVGLWVPMMAALMLPSSAAGGTAKRAPSGWASSTASTASAAAGG